MRCTYLGILLPTKRMKLSTILCSWRFERVDVARNWRHPDGFDHAINVWAYAAVTEGCASTTGRHDSFVSVPLCALKEETRRGAPGGEAR